MTEHNGHNNYETWCVNLWLSNDETLYNKTTRLVRRVLAEADPRAAESTQAVADAIETFVNDRPEVARVRRQASFVSDLLGASLSDVDWREIAELWIDVARERT